eukprot:COSAG02_NODE_8677_length_2483_cov_2.950084_3_plen_88_part_00
MIMVCLRCLRSFKGRHKVPRLYVAVPVFAVGYGIGVLAQQVATADGDGLSTNSTQPVASLQSAALCLVNHDCTAILYCTWFAVAFVL